MCSYNVAVQQEDGVERKSMPRGKVLGGSSAVNGMYYIRGSKLEYDAWAELAGDDRWDWDSVYAAQKEAEIAEVDREVWKLNQSYKGETGAVITTSILAKRECQLEFQLTYRVSSFAWLPICSHLTFACSC